jgi:UDP-2-acetamido-3-amino-2,3-dideoxy-glucuronate N-acetyltransferase
MPNYALAFGNPARIHGFVCPCGERLEENSRAESDVMMKCLKCGSEICISLEDFQKIV